MTDETHRATCWDCGHRRPWSEMRCDPSFGWLCLKCPPGKYKHCDHDWKEIGFPNSGEVLWCRNCGAVRTTDQYGARRYRKPWRAMR